MHSAEHLQNHLIFILKDSIRLVKEIVKPNAWETELLTLGELTADPRTKNKDNNYGIHAVEN